MLINRTGMCQTFCDIPATRFVADCLNSRSVAKRETLEQTTVFLRFGAALAIGLLVGLEREYSFIEPNQALSATAPEFSLPCSLAFASPHLNSKESNHRGRVQDKGSHNRTG